MLPMLELSTQKSPRGNMYRQEDPEVNIEQIIAKIKGLFGGSSDDSNSSGGGNKWKSKVPYARMIGNTMVFIVFPTLT